MNLFLRSLLKSLSMFVTDKIFIIMTILALSVSFISADVYHQLVVDNIPVMVCDADNSSVSRTIVTFLGADHEIRLVPCSAQSLEKAHDLIDRGEVTAIVYLPSNLSTLIKKGQRAEIPIALDASNNLMAKNAYKAIATVIGTVSAGIQLVTVEKLGVPVTASMGDVIPIEINENDSFNPAHNYVIYIAPPLTLFFLHLFVLIAAGSFLILPRRFPKWQQRFGSMAAVWLIGMLISLLFIYVYLPYQTIIPASPAWLILGFVGILLILDCMMAWAISRLFTWSPGLGFEATILIGMLSLMFSGVTWPTDMFPPVIEWFSYIIPFTPFAKAMRILLHFPARFQDIHQFLSLFGIEALIFLLLGGAGIATEMIIKKKKRLSSVPAMRSAQGGRDE